MKLALMIPFVKSVVASIIEGLLDDDGTTYLTDDDGTTNLLDED